MRAIDYLQAEYYKLHLRGLLLVVLIFSILPFAITQLFILYKSEALISARISADLIRENALGAWTTFLFPLLCMLITQAIAGYEHETNSLNYYKSSAINWALFFTAKVIVAYAFVFLAGGLTIVFELLNNATFRLIIGGPADFLSLTIRLLQIYGSATLYCLPLIAFHLFLSLTTTKAYISFAIGLVILIVGIPIVNLTNFTYNPYLLLVASRKIGILNTELITYSGSLILVVILAFWWLQKRSILHFYN